MRFLGALLLSAAATVVAYAAIDAYMAVRSEVLTDAELRARHELDRFRRQWQIMRQVEREAPYLHFAVWELLEEAQADG